jgi:hypothetical protein
MSVILFDGRNHPPAVTLVADGIGGGLLYTGTPASGKDFTAAQYADYKAHGLITIMGYENNTNDISGGKTSGTQHGNAFLADCRAKNVSFNEPALSTVDEHVASADLDLAMEYQDGFRAALKSNGWTGPIGIYGFSEVLGAAHATGNADFYFGAGRRSSMPSYTNIWQDNTGTILIGGSADDRDVVLIPLPTGGTVANALTTDDIPAIAQACAAYKNVKDAKDVDMHQHAVDATAALAAVTALAGQVAALTKQVTALTTGTVNVGTFPVTGGIINFGQNTAAPIAQED